MEKFFLIRGAVSGFVRIFPEELYPNLTAHPDYHGILGQDLSEEEALALARVLNANIKQQIGESK